MRRRPLLEVVTGEVATSIMGLQMIVGALCYLGHVSRRDVNSDVNREVNVG